MTGTRHEMQAIVKEKGTNRHATSRGSDMTSKKITVPAGTFTREIVNRQRVRLIDVQPGDTIPGIGEVVTNEPNGKNRLVTLTDGSKYNAHYRKFEIIERRVF
jgi:hypothetical protein